MRPPLPVAVTAPRRAGRAALRASRVPAARRLLDTLLRRPPAPVPLPVLVRLGAPRLGI